MQIYHNIFRDSKVLICWRVPDIRSFLVLKYFSFSDDICNYSKFSLHSQNLSFSYYLPPAAPMPPPPRLFLSWPLCPAPTPGENRETIQETIDFCKDLELIPEVIFFMTPYPGTELYQMAWEQGKIENIRFDQLIEEVRAERDVGHQVFPHGHDFAEHGYRVDLGKRHRNAK